MNRLVKTVTSLVAGVLFLSSFSTSSAEEEVRFGYDVSYASKVLRKDIKIAVEFILGESFQKNGIKLKFVFSDDPKKNLDSLLSGQLKVGAISALTFAQLEKSQRDSLETLFIVQRGETPLTTFHFLTLEDNKTLSDLEGGKLRCMTHWHREMDLACLNQFLFENEQPDSSSFFKEIVVCEEPDDAILPAFFGQAKACIVSDSDYQLLTDLNPQIKARLKPIATFNSLAPVIIVKQKDYNAPGFSAAIEAATRIHETPEGQQAFTILRMKQFSKITLEQLQPTFDLAKRIANRKSNKTAATSPKLSTKTK